IDVFCRTLGHCVPLARREVRDFPPFSFARPPAPITAHRNGSPLALPRGSEPTRLGLHFHDPRSGLGVMGGIEFSSAARTQSGRLMLSLGGTEMVLFTGEDETTVDSGRVQVGGCVWQSEGDGLTISYHGPVMRFAHPQAFIRLEEGLASSW